MAAVRQWREEEAPALWEEARRLVNQGQLLALPTETFYALAAHPYKEEALAALASLKGRTAEKPLLLLISGQEMLFQVVAELPEVAPALMERFWPGPLTLIFPARPGLSRYLTGDTGGVGVRWPRQEVTCRLIAALGHPVTGTSANRAGEPPLTRAEEVARELGEELALILDAGPCPGGLPSTVLDLTRQPPRLVRDGAVAPSELKAIIPELDTKAVAHG